MFISGGSRHQGKRVDKVSVIGGGDLGMASVMSILSKVLLYILYLNYYPIFYHFRMLSYLSTDFHFPPFSLQCKVDKLVFIDVADSTTRGGSTDLEIFKLPNVEVFRGMLSSKLSRCPCTNAPELSHH